MPRVMYSILAQVLVLSTVYMLGRWDYSFGWILPFFLSSVRDYSNRKREVELAIHNASMNADDQEVIRAKLGEVPAWAIFPDVERCEWVNILLKNLWPAINERVELELKELEPKINKHIPFKSFSFNKIDFGQITPRVSGVKAYERTPNPDEIMIDVNFCYYGDAELSVSINKIEGGIKDISIEGTIRLVLKLVPKTTFIGAIEISFLEKPTFDFNLTTAFAPIDMFSTGDLLRGFCAEQISRHMVYPKKALIKIKDRKAKKREKEGKDDPSQDFIEGVIRVTVKAVSALDGLDGRTIRTFLDLGGQIVESPGAVVHDETASIGITTEMIRFSKDDSDLIVSASIQDGQSYHKNVDISSLNVGGKIDEKISLCPSGFIDMSLSWLELSSDKKDLDVVGNLRSALLDVYIESTKNLPLKHPDIYVKIDVAQQSHATFPQKPNQAWKRHFNLFLEDPKNETLTVTIVDQLSSANLGSFNYKLKDLMSRKQMEHKLQAFPLFQSAFDGEIIMSVKLRALKGAALLHKS